MIVGLKRASLVVVTTLVLIFSMATTFLPSEDIKKGGEMSGGHRDALQTKLRSPVDAHELDGKERRGMVLLFVSLGRNIKTMLSSTNLGVGFPYTVVGRHAVGAACGVRENEM